MKKILLGVALLGSLISCTEEIEELKEERVEFTDTTAVVIDKEAKVAVKNLEAFDLILSEFKDCKASISKSGSCKEFMAKAICKAYGIDDFQDGKNYLDYDKMPDKIKELDNWERVGGMNKENLEKAITLSNNQGVPVVFFNEGEGYVHLTVLKEGGKMTKSGKWGMKVPDVISYFPNRPKDSFTNKGLNWAYSNSSKLSIWTRKP